LFVEEIAGDNKEVLAETEFAKIEFVEFCVLKFV
jgi:hypothetical protein